MTCSASIRSDAVGAVRTTSREPSAIDRAASRSGLCAATPADMLSALIHDATPHVTPATTKRRTMLIEGDITISARLCEGIVAELQQRRFFSGTLKSLF